MPRCNFDGLHVTDTRRTSPRMLKIAVQQGRSERRGEDTLRYVELLSEARTPLADFFSILLEGKGQLKKLQGALRGRHCRVGRTFGISRNPAD